MVATPAAAARLAIATVALVLLWRVIEVNAVLYDESGRPRLDRLADATLETDTLSAETRAIRRVIQDDPAEVAALLMVARQHEKAGAVALASRAYRSALELAPHERDVLLFSAAHFLRHDEPLGVRVLDRLAADYPESRGQVFAALRQLLVSAPPSPAVVELLSRKPAWLGAFILDACSQGVEPALLAAWLPRARAASNAPPAETSCAIDRLRAAGRVDQAYQLWLNSLPRESLAHVGFVFNGSFEDPPSGIGFDWMLQQRPESEAGHVADVVQTTGAAGKRALRVAYNGKRQSGVPVRQYLALAPGQYVMTGMARPESIKALRGIHWTLRCAEGTGAGPVIATSERFIGSSEWRAFSMQARIDAGCRSQLLQLEPADGGAVSFISGVAWFDDVRMQRSRG